MASAAQALAPLPRDRTLVVDAQALGPLQQQQAAVLASAMVSMRSSCRRRSHLLQNQPAVISGKPADGAPRVHCAVALARARFLLTCAVPFARR